MEKRLKFVRMSSLEEIAVRRVGFLLCTNSDNRALFRETCSAETPSTKFTEWQNVVEAKMSKLELPESLRKQIICYVPEIGLRVRRREKNHLKDFQMTPDDICLTDPPKRRWIAAGAIVDRETHEEMVSFHLFNVDEPNDFISLCCLGNFIRPLWEDLSKEQKELYRKQPMERFLEFCWPRIQGGELSELDFLWRPSDRNLTSFHQWAFEKSAERCNRVASEHFFHRLTPEGRDASLMRAVRSVLGVAGPSENRSDVLFYLLSLLTPEQQMEIVRARPVDVLLCFLDWKRLHLFSENAGFIWPFVTPDSYGNLLHLVLDLISLKDCYVPRMLQELFERCPPDFKEHFVERESRDLLRRFSRRNALEPLRGVFTCLDAADRTRLVFSIYFLCDSYSCFLSDRWQATKLCLREAALSEEDKERWRKDFTRMFNDETEAEKRRRFFEFLDETDDVKKSRKRKLESCSKE